MTRVQQLYNWVESKHLGQIIKGANQAYLEHLVAVAEMAAPLAKFGYEVGLCHDILEKTKTNPDELRKVLISFGYNLQEADAISVMVIELTDVFTKECYPEINKSSRKKREDRLLIKISSGAQTVKYCDLIYNIHWIMNYDRDHAKKYLERKRKLLNLMTSGDASLHQKVTELIHKSLSTFEVRN